MGFCNRAQTAPCTPNTQAPFCLLHPPLPRGHRKHTTNQPAHCPAQHQPSPPRCPADTPPAPGLSQAAPAAPALELSQAAPAAPAPGLSQAAPAAPAQGPAPPTELHSGAQSIHEKETLSRQALSFSIASIQISKRLHYKPQW